MAGKYTNCIYCNHEFFYQTTETSVECPHCMSQTPVEPTGFDEPEPPIEPPAEPPAEE